MPEASEPQETITLSSLDGQTFEVPVEAANQSEMIKGWIEDAKPGEAIPLPTIKSDTLSKVLEWCKFHTDAVKETDGKAHKTKKEIEEFDKDFVTCPLSEFFDTILAANYLNIVPILQITGKKLADDIKEAKTVEGIREKLCLVNDFTPEEEAKIAEENAWVKELCPED